MSGAYANAVECSAQWMNGEGARKSQYGARRCVSRSFVNIGVHNIQKRRSKTALLVNSHALENHFAVNYVFSESFVSTISSIEKKIRDRE